ncbi:MAG: DPP IV N-terminal domain-containing protein [Mariniblastus sp.]
MKKFAFALLTCVLTLMNFSATEAMGQDGNESDQPSPLTVAEKSDFKSTSLSAEVVEFVDACDKKASHVTKFVWGETVEGREMVGAIVSKKAYKLGDQDDRNVVLLLGNIHSGECAGKEALLMMLRELAGNVDHPWLEKNVILFAPNYNADANDRVGKNNRPGQVGPVNGMGRRENAQQLDLNRDFCKIESPEARSLVALINKTNPHLFVDCHTTNGSKHQYGLTYDIPHNPATAEPIRNFLRQKMMPSVTTELKKKGQLTFYYGNFNAPENTKWTTYGHEPRYSTEYVGLRGRLAILSEAYSYLDYKGRIIATKDFVSALLDFSTENHESIHDLLATVEKDLIQSGKTQPERTTISLDAKAIAFDEKVPVKGFKDGEPHDYMCEFVGKYESTQSTSMPFAYLVPAEHARIVDRLLMHGVAVETLTADLKTEVEFDTIKKLSRNERAFQRHRMVRVEADRATGQREFPAETYVIRTAQPLGRWISYMLESESDDGFAFWNFLDAALEEGKQYPIVRIAKPMELATTAITKVKKSGKLSLDLIDGPNRLLSNAPSSPRWFGKTNWVKTKVYNRDFLLDAESVSLVDQPAQPFTVTKVKSALVDAGLEEKIAESISKARPQVATNNAVVILSAKGYSIVYYCEDGKDTKDAVEILAKPDSKASLFHFSDDESLIAFSTEKGLHFYDIDSRETKSVAAKDDKHFVGKLDWVYQEELYGRGNFKGYWWQKGAGSMVAFLELDETPLLPFTVMDHMPVRGKSEFTNYPKAGDPIPTVKVGVVDAKDPNKLAWVDLSSYGDEEILITRVTWSKDGSQLLLQVQNRVQTWLDLVSTDPQGDNPRVLFRDKTPAWIESPGDPVFLNDGEFLWRSPRSGYSHIYRYDKNGKLIGPVTEGDWEVRSLIGVDPEKKHCYFTATRDNAIDMHGYRADLSTGEIAAITHGEGSNSLRFSNDYSFFINSRSSVDQPSTYTLRKNDGEFVRRFNASSDDRLNYYDLSQPEFLEVPSRNDQPMDAMLIKPTNFDPTKKYPVLVHIYAGPQAPRVRNSFGGQSYLWHQMLAQQGYVIWMCDNQSASYRSAKNVWPVHQNFGQNELADIEKGLDHLKKYPWVDADRIGIWGWSYGGYMTAYALTHSKSFKMGISGAPVTDWKNYDAVYTERYMGLPQDNAEGYKSTSVLNNKAEDLHGKLLLIHGTIDDNVHLNNTIQFVKELQYAGKQFELMLYPSNRHSVRDKKQAAHMRKMMTEFIRENL